MSDDSTPVPSPFRFNPFAKNRFRDGPLVPVPKPVMPTDLVSKPTPRYRAAPVAEDGQRTQRPVMRRPVQVMRPPEPPAPAKKK